jgi:hypothetical protein
MHMASANLSLDVFPRVVALVMFGDPGFKENTRVRAFPVYLGSRLLENCAEGDPVSLCCPALSKFVLMGNQGMQ